MIGDIIYIKGDGKWLEKLFPGTKWKPFNMPLIPKEDILKHGIIDLTENSDKYKFTFPVPNK